MSKLKDFLCRIECHNPRDVIYYQSKDGKHSIVFCKHCKTSYRILFTFLWFSFWWDIKPKDFVFYGVNEK